MADSSDEDDTVEISLADDEPLVRKFVPCRKPKRLDGAATYDDQTTYIEICVVGNVNVGKSSTMKRIAERKFDGTRNATIGIDTLFVNIMSNAPAYDRKTHVSIVDTAGDDRFMSVVPQRLRSPFGIFLMFDATRRETFDALTRWSEIVSRHNDYCCRMLVANKIDLYKKLPEAERWMDSINWENECDRLLCDEGFHCVSALDGENIDSMFVEMVDYAIERQAEIEKEAAAGDSAPQRAGATNSGVVNISNKVTNYTRSKTTCQC